MSIDICAVREPASVPYPAQDAAAVWFSDPPASRAAFTFASLIDLARMQFGAATVEICEACSTVNLGSAQHCKGCAHKLPAYYARSELDPKLPRLEDSPLPLHRRWSLQHRASYSDFAAFALVVNLLLVVAEFVPLH